MKKKKNADEKKGMHSPLEGYKTMQWAKKHSERVKEYDFVSCFLSLLDFLSSP